MVKRLVIYVILILCLFQIVREKDTALGDITGLGGTPNPSAKCLYFLPHEDDDLLFMNPDILENITAGHCVLSVFLTAGDKHKEPSYWLGREAGIKAAYAYMARVKNVWIEAPLMIEDKQVVRFILRDSPNIALIFLRLPDGIDIRKGEVTLRTIWQYDQVIIYTKDQVNLYRQKELVKVLNWLMVEYEPTAIGYIYPGIHEDHRYVAKFVELALPNQVGNPALIKYRDYNINNAPPNLSRFEAHLKWKIVQIYGGYDPDLPKYGSERLYKKYAKWCQRQYYYEDRSFGAQWRNQPDLSRMRLERSARFHGL